LGIPREAYDAFQSIVGSEWVSDDPAICAADYKGGAATGIRDKGSVRPACSIQPKSSEEVRRIVKVCNRFSLPYVPTSTYFSATCAPNRDNTVMMDLKRMDKFDIDYKNMYAVVEPGVSFSMLQAELFKRDLFTFVPGCGSQASVLANNLHIGDAPMGWRVGLGYRRLLACEWVLPDGELLKLGSRSYLKDYFWGEGPGPDLRGLLRGNGGPNGGLGTVTKLAVKVFSFIPKQLEPQGIQPKTTFKLPEERMRWYNARFPSLEQTLDAIYELGRCEIGFIVMHVDPIFGYIARSRGKGANFFWQEWDKAKETLDRKQGWLRVLLTGFTSEKQLVYEENVLRDVVTDYGGELRPARPLDETHLQSADAIAANAIGRRFYSIIYFESVDAGLAVGRADAKIKERYTPPLADTYGLPGWIVPYDFAHVAKQELLNYGDVDDVEYLSELHNECRKNDIKIGAYPYMEDPDLFGPFCFNYHQKLRGFKAIFDPNNVSNPPKPLTRN